MILRMALPLAACLLLTALAATARPADPPGKYWVYIGTYTGGKDGSKGIYRCELDVKTGRLSPPELAVEATNPSFLAISPDGKTLYAVGEVADLGPKRGEGAVAAYRIGPTSGSLVEFSQQTTGGAGPCYVSTDNAGKFAAVANYGGGSCAVYKLRDDGGFAARTAFEQHKGKAADPQRQEAPHAHCAVFDAKGDHLLVSDLGLDQVLVYPLDRQTGYLGAPAVVKMPAGAGPRHVALTPANDLMFVCGELASTVSVVRLNLPMGTSEVVQTISTLPGGKPVKGNSTAEVRLHPNGKFVYVSNRGHNSVAAFRWDGSKLTPVGYATEGIKTPRNFNIDPTGRWMLVASQDGDDLAVFEIDPDGLPKPTGNKVSVPKPVCVKFLARP